MSAHVDSETAAEVERFLSEAHTVPVGGPVAYLRAPTPDGRRVDALTFREGPIAVIEPAIGVVGEMTKLWIDGDEVCGLGWLTVRGARPQPGYSWPVGIDLAHAVWTHEDAETGEPLDSATAMFTDRPVLSIAREAVLMVVVLLPPPVETMWPNTRLEVVDDGRPV